MENKKVNTHGEVDWNDPSADNSEKKSGKDLFLRLNQGSNVLRLITLPHQYYQHKYKIEGEKGYGHRIACSGIHGSCPVCAKDDKPKRRWLVGVIDRKTNTYKILDIGYGIFKSIKTLATDSDWGNPENFDIDVVVDPNGSPMNYYTVVAKPPKPLSAGDIKIKENDVDMEELKRRTLPPTPEWVNERLSKLMEEFSSHDAASPIKASAVNGKITVETSDDDEFLDYDKTPKTVASAKAPF